MKHEFKGIFAALTTPFVDDEISPEKFKQNIQRYNSFDLAGYVILGSSGEALYLTEQESVKIVQTAKESTTPGKKIIVGTAKESAKLTVEFTNRMANFEIDAALVRTPSYYKSQLTEQALKSFYLTVADKSRVPVLIYHIPRLTGISLDMELIVELSQHPNIAGMKDSSGNLAFMSELVPRFKSEFNLLLGAGSIILSGLSMGAQGGILALATVAPGKCCELYKLFLEGRIDEARRLQVELIPLNKAMIQIMGIPAIKYALDAVGYFGGHPRLPLLPLEEPEKRKINNILEKLDLLL